VAKAGVAALKGLKNAVVEVPSLSDSGAQAVLAAAQAKAAELQSPLFKRHPKMHIYVIGIEGTTLASSQENGAWPGSADIALRKARTAIFFKLPTRVIGELSRPEMKDKGPLYGIEHSNGGLISFPGGLPLMDEAGNTIGAIGVSGDTVELDEQVAQAGVDALKALLKKPASPAAPK
jgi:uncharacterized protein GlcG (DUF336 family)